MDLFFRDSSEIPLPPEDVRIRHLNAVPWSDGRRVHVLMEITPFQQRPNGEISVIDAQGNEVANLSIIETAYPKMEFTVHLLLPSPEGHFHVLAKVFYNLEKSERKSEETPNKDQLQPPLPGQIRIVDQAETTFEIKKGAD